MLCGDTVIKLIEIYRDEEKILKAVERAVLTFEEYHNAVFKMELWIKVYSNAVSREEYQDRVSGLDKLRTSNHNSVLGSVSLLNRLAEKNGLAPVYDGVVSRERPYRTEVADAVFEYVEQMIKNRR